MKKRIAVMMMVTVVAHVSHSQDINWRSLREDQRNVVQFNYGYDYGVTAQLGYGRTFHLFRPVFVGLDYSFPMGGEVFDDFKARIGGQMEVVEMGGFSATIRVSSVFRRYQTELVRV